MPPSDRPYRRSIRLPDYDYAQAGAYFVTICVQDRLCLFGAVVDGVMHRNEVGQMIQTAWLALPERFSAIALDAFVVMPNHFHAIVFILGAPTRGGAPLVGAPTTDTDVPATPVDIHAPAGGLLVGVRADDRPDDRARPTLGRIIGAFKSITTIEYLRGVHTGLHPPVRGRLWQRNYYEHIIRTDAALSRIRRYIHANPARWTVDRENPERQSDDPFDQWLDTSVGAPLVGAPPLVGARRSMGAGQNTPRRPTEA